MLRVLGSLRGLRVQLLLWTVLPLTLVLVAVSLVGITTHQHAMRDLVEELDARSAQLAAAHLSASLEERRATLEVLADRPLGAEGPGAIADDAIAALFDGGVAGYDASGTLREASPTAAVWRARPVLELLGIEQVPGSPAGSAWPGHAVFSAPFPDAHSGNPTLLVAWVSQDEGMLVGATSLEQLGFPGAILQSRTVHAGDAGGQVFAANPGSSPSGEANGAMAFLVNAEGRVIYHPDAQAAGQDWSAQEGVKAALEGQTGAAYYEGADGRELVVGYAPVAGPGWGLIVQEPWEGLIAPAMRLSLLAPLTMVAAGLVSGLALSFGLRYVVHPLQALDRQATRVAWGDFAAVGQAVGGIQEIEDLRRTLQGMADQIQRYQSGMRDYIAAVTMAQEEERKRLARELHDETVQSLIALGHRVEMVDKALDKDPARARQRLVELRALADEAQAEVRRFSRALRPLYLEDLGFVPALEMLAQEIGPMHGVDVEVEVEGEVRRLAPDLELAAFRIVQEGLSNVVRHAAAQAAWLTVVFNQEGLVLRVRDDGRGFNPPVNPADLVRTGHFGLMGMRERALLLGGQMEVRSNPGQGTRLEVFLPLDSAA